MLNRVYKTQAEVHIIRSIIALCALLSGFSAAQGSPGERKPRTRQSAPVNSCATLAGRPDDKCVRRGFQGSRTPRLYWEAKTKVGALYFNVRMINESEKNMKQMGEGEVMCEQRCRLESSPFSQSARAVRRGAIEAPSTFLACPELVSIPSLLDCQLLALISILYSQVCMDFECFLFSLFFLVLFIFLFRCCRFGSPCSPLYFLICRCIRMCSYVGM